MLELKASAIQAIKHSKIKQGKNRVPETCTKGMTHIIIQSKHSCI